VQLPSTVLAEIARARRRAGLGGLTELEASTLLRDLADIRALPETDGRVVVPSARRPRTGNRLRAGWWALR
jgi:hypothetical protein